MAWSLPSGFRAPEQFRQLSHWLEHRRAKLLCARVRDYFEERQRRISGTFRPCLEQVVYEFEQRGYLSYEIHDALRALTKAGVLDHLQGWYVLRDNGASARGTEQA